MFERVGLKRSLTVQSSPNKHTEKPRLFSFETSTNLSPVMAPRLVQENIEVFLRLQEVDEIRNPAEKTSWYRNFYHYL